MNYAEIKYNDIANGPGVRTTLFVSGCRRGCKGCFNKIAWDFNYGKEITEDVMKEIIDSLRSPYIQGLTILGGEPFENENRPGVAKIVERVKSELPEKDIWIFSGFVYDVNLTEFCKTDALLEGDARDACRRILSNVDFLVDGPFVEELKSPSLIFKGSVNQRIINMKETLKTGQIIRWEKDVRELRKFSNTEK